MDPLTHRAYELMLGGTNQLVDNKRNVLLLRSCSDEDRAELLRMIVDKRREWHKWLILTQRDWQIKAPRHFRQRTVNAYVLRAGGIERAPARVRESMDTREKYVRCQYR